MQVLSVILPEITLSVGLLLLLLLLSVFDKYQIYTRYFVQVLLVLLLVALMFAYTAEPVSLWQGLFVQDSLSYYTKLLLVYAVLFITYFSKGFVQDYTVPILEMYMVMLLQLLGMMVVVSAKHMMSIFIGIELMYLPLYALVALPKNNKASLEAAIKYMIMGGLASSVMLYGVSLLYAVSGSLALDNIAVAVNTLFNDSAFVGLFTSIQTNMLLLSVALVSIMFAMVFKFGGGPFFIWVPDVYHGGSLIMIALVSSLPKLVLGVLWLRLFTDCLAAAGIIWQYATLIMGLIAIVVGSVYGLVQSNLKRLLAYSSIAHMGFVLIGLSMATPLANAATLAYIIGYVLSSVLVFVVLAQFRYAGNELLSTSELDGLWHRYPQWALVLLVSVFSMIGLPPLLGFMMKFYWLYALVAQKMYILATVALLFSAVGCYYYLRVVQAMFFTVEGSDLLLLTIDAARARLIYAAGFLLVLLGIYPDFLFGYVNQMLA